MIKPDGPRQVSRPLCALKPVVSEEANNCPDHPVPTPSLAERNCQSDEKFKNVIIRVTSPGNSGRNAG